MQLRVAIIGQPHGLKGEVRLDVRTDSPEQRLGVGAVLETEPPEAGPLTIKKSRVYKDSLFVAFEEVNDRTGAEGLRGVALVIETDEEEERDDEGWYRHELVGLEALDPDGYTLGTVTDLETMPAQDLLVVEEPDGKITRVPFVQDIVTEVDLEDGCVIIDAPPGLFSDEDIIIADGED
ncbi:ribosome maturation factor RimM [Flaviflexus equikiangi]|uniref:Ribosome maturation factor RimM n=1 Tax=Flaviflexus equikiangi TaxID=2758573 RepID=A0ABS2TFW1_9ACTO|nr:ribosome maturation factor RimM [Flaviflexus equikiangi]MBM9433003.1 ribosome maturation factor RimM [Flaviflexus equikiangi]